MIIFCINFCFYSIFFKKGKECGVLLNASMNIRSSKEAAIECWIRSLQSLAILALIDS